jgi:hypothetical protein
MVTGLTAMVATGRMAATATVATAMGEMGTGLALAPIAEPAGSTAEVIERLPSGTDFIRVVKVKVTSPSMKATTGLTIEINR